MAVNTDTGSSQIKHGNFEAFNNVENTASTLANQVGERSASGTLPDAWMFNDFKYFNLNYTKFAGFDANNREKFNSAIDKYISDVNTILDGFNRKQDALANAFKGSVSGSLETFFANIKTICQSYVNAIAEEKNKVLEAENNWLEATKSIGSAIDSDSDVKPVDSVVINN